MEQNHRPVGLVVTETSKVRNGRLSRRKGSYAYLPSSPFVLRPKVNRKRSRRSANRVQRSFDVATLSGAFPRRMQRYDNRFNRLLNGNSLDPRVRVVQFINVFFCVVAGVSIESST